MYQRAQLPFATKQVCSGAQLPHTYNKARLCGAQLPHAVSGYQGPAPPHCLRLSGPSSPDNKSQKFFKIQRAQLPHTYSKARLCGAQLPHAVSDYQGPAPLITHTARQDFVGPSSPTLSQIIRAQLPHTVSDYQGPAHLIISHQVQLADLDD